MHSSGVKRIVSCLFYRARFFLIQGIPVSKDIYQAVPETRNLKTAVKSETIGQSFYDDP